MTVFWYSHYHHGCLLVPSANLPSLQLHFHVLQELLAISQLHTGFKLTRSRVYSINKSSKAGCFTCITYTFTGGFTD
jgi:hypothetical protein